jgi:hypothetical protein
VAGAAKSIYTLSFWQEGDDAWNGTAFSVSLLWLDAPYGTSTKALGKLEF